MQSDLLLCVLHVSKAGFFNDADHLPIKLCHIYERGSDKRSFGHFSSFYVIIILKSSKISIFCMFLQESQIASNM